MKWEKRYCYERVILFRSDKLIAQLIRFKPNTFLKPHYHKKKTEYFYTLSGEGVIDINGETKEGFVECKQFDVHTLESKTEWLILNIQLNRVENDIFWETVVLSGFCGDLFHVGHLNVIKEGAKLGNLIVCVLGDEAIKQYKPAPIIPYEQREEIFKNIKGVWKVVGPLGDTRKTNYVNLIRRYKPDYMIHGDDYPKDVKDLIKKELKGIGGTLVEIPKTKGVSTTIIRKRCYDRCVAVAKD